MVQGGPALTVDAFASDQAASSAGFSPIKVRAMAIHVTRHFLHVFIPADRAPGPLMHPRDVIEPPGWVSSHKTNSAFSSHRSSPTGTGAGTGIGRRHTAARASPASNGPAATELTTLTTWLLKQVSAGASM